jgi:hypothetical protein
MTFPASRSILFVLCFVCFVGYAICAALPRRAPPALHLENHQKRDENCGFQGNPDLYGLGIRLGVYFQWASAQIIYGWYPEGRNDLAESYLVFLFAIIVAVIVITAQAEPTYAGEILILIYIIFGGIYTVLGGGARQHHLNRIKKSSVHYAQLFTFSIIMTSTCIYCSWFWLHGLRHNVLQTPCGTYGFLFTKVSLYNESVSKFFAACSIFLAIIAVYSWGFWTVLLFLYIIRVPKVVRLVDVISSNPLEPSEAAEHRNPSSTGGPPEHTNGVSVRSQEAVEKRSM